MELIIQQAATTLLGPFGAFITIILVVYMIYSGQLFWKREIEFRDRITLKQEENFIKQSDLFKQALNLIQNELLPRLESRK